MIHQVIGIVGLLLLVLGVVLIILQITEGEKTVIRSIAGSATPIFMGTILIVMSRVLERKKKASIELSDTPK